MRQMVPPVCATTDGDDATVVPTHFPQTSMAQLESYLMGMVIRKPTAVSACGHGEIFLEDEHAKKASLNVNAKDGPADIRLYFAGRVTMIPTKNSIFVAEAVLNFTKRLQRNSRESLTYVE